MTDDKLKKITVALAGNPNSGKTSIFNMLTGAHHHVANYPGTTVETKQAFCTYKDVRITFVDLPGTYGLTTFSTEELVARNFIVDKNPDVVVDVIDCSNVERNLYLTTQLIEIDVPLVLAFNMSDIARQLGIVFDTEQLSTLLEVPIVPTVASRAEGRLALLDAIIAVANTARKPRTHRISYGDEIEKALSQIEPLIRSEHPDLAAKYGSHWLALKLLEQDGDILSKVQSRPLHDALDREIGRLKTIFGDDPEVLIADKRYGFISGACQETVKTTVELRHTTSDLADAVLIHHVLGLPIFLLLMYLVFYLTFSLAVWPMAWLERLFGWLSASLAGLWPPNTDNWLRSLLIDGIIPGVGGILVFLPNILILFLAIALLEDSGYMARAAFIMDRLMHKIGLHGKSFIPMLIGFGCSIPAIMATRILENRRNRFTTIMVLPLMSCGARLTIYGLLIPAFFSQSWRGPVLWLIYLTGIVLAVIAAKVLRLTVFRGEDTDFVMELPPYRVPTAKSILIHTWLRGWMYLKKAGTIILAFSIILWAAMNYPKAPKQSLAGLTADEIRHAQLANSVIGRLGRAIEPVIKPLGFDWKIGTALIGATAAKELFVSQLGIIYAVSSRDDSAAVPTLRSHLQADYSPLVGLCIMLFCLISSPCIATVAVTRQETNSWRWAFFQFFSLTALAYAVTFVVYQIGALLLNI
ncbi:MAG: ferrous iron transport protein B [Sedimentisphaerales bacterium]|nr:ferrous iron transport protein B [Sedimentisphaerales bacterium]